MVRKREERREEGLKEDEVMKVVSVTSDITVFHMRSAYEHLSNWLMPGRPPKSLRREDPHTR